MTVNHPNWHPIPWFALNWYEVVSILDLTDVFRVADLTGGGGNASRAARTSLSKGMEDGFQIHNELSVYRTVVYGIQTVNYKANMKDYVVYGHGNSWYEV